MGNLEIFRSALKVPIKFGMKRKSMVKVVAINGIKVKANTLLMAPKKRFNNYFAVHYFGFMK